MTTATRTPQTLTTYTCPTCPARVSVIPSTVEVGHRCPMRRGNAWATFTTTKETEA